MTPQELKSALDAFMLENTNQEITATLLNGFLTDLITNSVHQNLANADQSVNVDRVIDMDSNVITFKNLEQMKGSANHFPPIGEGNFDFQLLTALTDDPGFVLRHSSGTPIFEVLSNGSINMGPTSALGSSDRSFSVNSVNHSQVNLGTVYDPDPTAKLTVKRRLSNTVGTYNDNTFLFFQQSFADGNQYPYRYHFVNPSDYYDSSAPDSISAGFMFFRDDAVQSNMQFGIKPDNTIEHYSHPTHGSPVRTDTISGYIQYARDSNGVKHPTWRLSDANEVALFVQDLSSNPTNEQIAQFLENLGLANLI